MKNKIKIICLALAMALAPITGNVMADKHDKVGPYAGLGFGYTSFDAGDQVTPKEQKVWAPAVFGGYMFHRHFGVEGGLQWDISEADNNESSFTSLYLAGIGRYHLSDEFAVYAKGGFHRWETDSDVAGAIKTDSIDGLFGAGMQYDLSEHASLRLEYVRYLVDEDALDGEADILGFRMLYRF